MSSRAPLTDPNRRPDANRRLATLAGAAIVELLGLVIVAAIVTLALTVTLLVAWHDLP